LYTNSLLKSPPEKETRPRISADPHRSAFIRGGFILLVLICLSANLATAQTNLNSHVTISISTPGQIKVEAELATPINSWSFRNAYAGILGIAERIENFRAADVVVQKAAVGEYRSDRKSSRISYTVNVPKPTLADISHVTWFAEDRGVLMLADLIPVDVHSLSAEFVLPEGWTMESAISRDASGRYEAAEPEKAVFFFGRSLRKTSATIEQMPLDLVVSGSWRFKDEGALKAAHKVFKKYLELTGYRLPGRSTIMIVPLPVAVGSVKWRAETRGSTVLLLLDQTANFSNWIGQLGVIFTHELLHLWVPNSLRLDGDYDWFFEGFTLYTALRTALELKIITFKEFLDTLARVYDSYLSYPNDLSLIDASERRWTTAGSFVYEKGMMAAFLYDLQLRMESAGKSALADKYRELFARPGDDHVNGNEVIIGVLGSSPALEAFSRSYIEKSTTFELERLLPAYGLTLDSSGTSSRLRISGGLSADQKRLLRSLGYRD
jgi:hypothetical protein